ncbi:MAG: hypothetical protein ABI839_05410, partial [Verrucomicrobiota bacterium]
FCSADSAFSRERGELCVRVMAHVLPVFPRRHYSARVGVVRRIWHEQWRLNRDWLSSADVF